MRTNPLNFDPPLPPSSDELAQRVCDAGAALNSIGTVEYATNPSKVADLAAEYDRALDALAAHLRAVGDAPAADTILMRRTRRP